MAPPNRRAAGRPRPAGDRDVTYEIRLWAVKKHAGSKGTTYSTRWVVAKRQRSRSFTSRALAESFRSDLRSAANRGEPFDVETGLPVSMLPSDRETLWWDWVIRYVDLKWQTLAPKSRMSLAEAMSSVTLALLATDRGMPEPVKLRSVMKRWAFVTPTRSAGPPPAGLEGAAAWLAKNTRPVVDLEKGALVREVLTALSRRLDGTQAAGTTVARKRAAFHNCLEMAVEHELLTANPLDRIKWRPPKTEDAVDPSVVIDPAQARALLDAIRETPGGERLVAFFALMYYAALRPSEALALHWDDVVPPDRDGGWGWLRISRSNASVAGLWNDGGKRTPRHLKHRAAGAIRVAPCPPDLRVLLTQHRERFGVAADGRLFRGANEGHVRDEEYLSVWRAARRRVVDDGVMSVGAVARPYDLRHSAVSTWLAAGVDPTQIAAWAGHSVGVMLRVYAHVMPSRTAGAIDRIAQLLDTSKSDVT